MDELNLTSVDICYLFKYVEKNGRPNGNPWSIRQSGVYHRYSPKLNSNVWLLLHPLADSVAQRRLNDWYSRPHHSLNINPLRIHILLLSSYLDNWRWYLKDLGNTFLNIVSKATRDFVRLHSTEGLLTSVQADISMTIDIQEDYDLSFTTLQDLRHLEQKVIPLRASFQANLEIVQVLEATNKEFQNAGFYTEEEAVEQTDCLRLFVSQLRGHLLSVKILEKRIQGVVFLVRPSFSPHYTFKGSNDCS